MKRKILNIVIPFILISGSLFSSEELALLISQHKWDRLAAVFSDESHITLEKYFKDSLSIKFVTYNINQLTYKAKFENYAEIGTITYEKKDKKYYKLEILNQISPLFFIERFRKYSIKDTLIQLGEAEVYFQEGEVYQSVPFNQVLIFKGDWRFSITPSDQEERLTLIHQFKKETFSKSNLWGIFILTDKGFLEKLNPVGFIEKEHGDIVNLLEIYRKYFGIKIKQFDEYWYLPFKPDDNLVIFRKDKDTFYLYDFNANLNPDTLLRTSVNSKIILSYNSIKSAKLSFQEVDRIEKIDLNLFYNPETNFISGTVNLSFKNPAPFKVLNLAKELKIRANLDRESRGLSVVRKQEVYYFLGPPTHNLSLFYSGTIEPEVEYTDIFKRQVAKIETMEMDNFFYLSRTQNFYPNSYIDFSEIDVSVSVNKRFNCLASGQLTEIRKSDRNTYSFFSPGAKGISVICGNFKLNEKITAKVPLNIYSAEFSSKSRYFHTNIKNEPKKKYASGFDRLARYFDFEKLKEAWEFMLEKYGPLDITEVNFLFKKGLQEGGISEKGLIMFNFNPDISISQIINRDSPILLSNDPTNHLIHELAHQWWGGLISWKTYRDLWITEGMAQFSVIFYLENTLPEKRFSKILKKVKRWIYKDNDAGPVIYGRRIISIDDNYEAYQSIIYNKSVFIFLMLKDMLGEEEFLKRLTYTIEKFKYKSIASSTFINAFSEDNKLIDKFFKNWIFSRKIPKITFESTIQGKKAQILIDQKGSNFVFPLTFEIRTEKGSFLRTFTVKGEEEYFNLEEDSEIKSITLDETRALVRTGK